MKFNGDGYLDAGLHPTTPPDIKKYLVDTFPATSTRPKIFAGYQRHTSELQSFPVNFSQFLDGSFVSSKEDPGDIDLLCMGDRATIDALPHAEQVRLENLFLGPGSKPAFDCDTYFLASCPETDPGFPIYRGDRKYWMGEFGFDRVDRPKGILTVTIAPAPAPATSTASATP